MIRRIGFTGTREGMTAHQQGVFANELAQLIMDTDGVVEFHSGDCVGADAQAHYIANRFQCYTVGHPPINPTFRAYCKYDDERGPKGYFERDEDIVNECEMIFATPKSKSPNSGGGTWYTIKYAQDKGKKVVIIWPDGSLH